MAKSNPKNTQRIDSGAKRDNGIPRNANNPSAAPTSQSNFGDSRSSDFRRSTNSSRVISEFRLRPNAGVKPTRNAQNGS